MIVKKLIEKIEGEAELDFYFNKGLIDDVQIHHEQYRGIEEVLVGRVPKDALVIAPRVCGVCSHAHLIAVVRALEDGYRNAGVPVNLSAKAASIREFTLSCELIQNHIKWLYLTMLPELKSMAGEEPVTNDTLKAAHVAAMVNKAMAIFAGQWPHSSYAVPGGVTCDPTYIDVMKAEGMIDQVIVFFEKEMAGIPFGEYMSIHSISDIDKVQGDMGRVLGLMEKNGLSSSGKSHDRFIAFGNSCVCKVGKSMGTKVYKVDVKYVKEHIQKDTTAKAVTYKNRFFEVGPLARGMIRKEPLIKSFHRQYKDAAMSRVFARIHEVALLLEYTKKILGEMDVRETSCPYDEPKIMPDCDGVGIVEAAKGSLIHKISVRSGLITHYDIIAPTQWNLSQGSGQQKGVAVEGMLCSKDIESALFILRTFDVCSTCISQ